jgi:hypothetical protein
MRGKQKISIKPPPATPWIVLGDLNHIHAVQDKNNHNLNRRLMGIFRHILDTCELFEFALQNRKYTWSNERQEPTLVRLDRVFCNAEWDLEFSGFTLQALSSSLSDHCPLLLCHQATPRKKEVFRFENFWVRVPGFRDVVKDAWQHNVLGISPLNILYYKLKNMARVLKAWSRELLGNACLKLHMANDVIKHLDEAQERMLLTQDEFLFRKDLKARVPGLATVERSWRQQASWVVWLREGDACTYFFHLKVNG